MSRNTIVVTGAHGFIGRNVARYYYQQGWNVVGLGHGQWSNQDLARWGISQWYECEITLENLRTFVSGIPDAIVHCAGSGSVGFSITNPLQDYRRTVESTINVLEYIRLYAGSSAMIYPSSAAVYGIVEDLPIQESCLLQPVSPYGVHKRIAEDLCKSYSSNFGISTSIIRLFSVYGVGLNKQLLWDACQKLSRGEIEFFGTGEETRDWLHIDDVVKLIRVAHDHTSADCRMFNGGAGKAVTVSELLEEIFSCFGRVDKAVFTGNDRPGDPAHYQADITEALTYGWKPEVEWQQGIKEYVNWFRSGAV